MPAGLERHILDAIQHLYQAIGWPGVVLLMALESAGIPVPSEIIMPLAGWFLVEAKNHGFAFVVLAAFVGALGNTLGSVVAYYIGAWGGRPLLERYGRYILITRHDLDRADAFFARRGGMAVFVGRVLPLVRTYISFPAGIARMEMRAFTTLTFIGSFLWSLGLAWAGYALGEHYDRIRQVMRPFDYPIAALVLLGIAWFIWRHVRRKERDEAGTPSGGAWLAAEHATTRDERGADESAGAMQHSLFQGPYPPTRYSPGGAAARRPGARLPADDDAPRAPRNIVRQIMSGRRRPRGQ